MPVATKTGNGLSDNPIDHDLFQIGGPRWDQFLDPGADWRPAASSSSPSGSALIETYGYGELGTIKLLQGGSSGSTTISTATAAPTPTLVTTSGSGLKVNLVWDSSVASAPSGFQTDVVNAVSYIESKISTTATLTINVGYGEIGGSALSGGALGESESYLVKVSYASLVAALKATASSDATDTSMLASLPMIR